MAKDLREKLDRLRAAAPKLNEATNDAAAVVRDIERYLEELGIGISAKSEPFSERPAFGDDDSGRFIFSYLAYGRIAGRYRIHVLETVEERNPSLIDVWDVVSKDQTPWSSCHREEKLRSFEKLPELLDALTEEALNLVAQAEHTTETVRGLADALGAQKGDTGKVNPPPGSALAAQKRDREQGRTVRVETLDGGSGR